MTARGPDSVLVDPPAAPARAATLRTLAGVEARRYARHPLFLLGAVLIVADMILNVDNITPAGAAGDREVAPAVFLGLLGVFVGYQLTRSMTRTGDAIEAAPADGVTRTAALCLACLVPGALTLVWVGWIYVSIAVSDVPASAAVSASDRAAMILAAVAYAVGGPLVGVMVGRWTRFPGAHLLAAAALVAWPILSGIVGAESTSRVGNLFRLDNPFTLWTSSGKVPIVVFGGSPPWYLAYVTVLCGLAATAAMLHEARGLQRARLARALLVLAVLALGCLTLASMADPTQIPL